MKVMKFMKVAGEVNYKQPRNLQLRIESSDSDRGPRQSDRDDYPRRSSSRGGDRDAGGFGGRRPFRRDEGGYRRTEGEAPRRIDGGYRRADSEAPRKAAVDSQPVTQPEMTPRKPAATSSWDRPAPAARRGGDRPVVSRDGGRAPLRKAGARTSSGERPARPDNRELVREIRGKKGSERRSSENT